MPERTGHTISGTAYVENGAAAYTLNRHGPDGSLFLDPVFTQFLTGLQGRNVIDIGAGAGPWSLFAKQQGARNVLAVEYQMDMLQKAQEADSSQSIGLVQADAAALPVAGNSFSLALSINVGCNLPPTSKHHFDETRTLGFQPHFDEMARVLQPDGQAIVTAPTSFGEVFTRGERSKDEVFHEIAEVLDRIGTTHDAGIITTQLNTLDDVYRATFARRDNRLVVVTNEAELQSGEQIWRKLPGLTVPNYYHAEEEYLSAAQNAGLHLTAQYHAMFTTGQERQDYNNSVSSERQLGQEYIKESGGKPPFAVFVFEKQMTTNL